MRRAVHLVLLALLVLTVLANGALAGALVVTREPAPKPLTAERVATASKPAIAFVQSNYTIATSMPQLQINQDALEQALRARVYSGELRTQAQIEHAAYQLILANPDVYFTPGSAVPDTWYHSSTGSGFFVTEDGYLVTAAHVVTTSKAEERDGIVAATKDPTWIADEQDTIRKDFAAYGPSDAEVARLVDFDRRWLAKYISVDRIDSSYAVATGPSVESSDSSVTGGIQASVVSVDPENTGHDIAILKADVTGVPALPLAGSDPHLGDATYAVGYPATAVVEHTALGTETFPIVVTVGKIQRMNAQTGPAGSWVVYGTDAQLAHGDSGGPIIDARGNVMGVMSFIVPDATGSQLPGQGYFVPSSFVRDDLAKANITVPPDPRHQDLTSLYYLALAKGDAGRYKDEVNILLGIEARSTMDTYVNDDVKHAQAEIRAGNDRTPPQVAGYMLPATGSAVGVILLALLAWLALGLTAGRKPLVEPSSPPGPAEPPPVPIAAVPAD